VGASVNAIFGGAFLLLALFLTFLMYHLWGYPFDKKKNRSSAPRSLMNLHRVLGYVFVGIYVLLIWEMVPRLWSYQVELPARTVLHLTLGIAVGALLIIKIAVVRFFKHMESTLAPFLGTGLLICTLLLTGLALPYAAREAYLRSTARDGENFSQERISRVLQFLPQIGFADEAGLEILASSDGLAAGRDVLTRKCTQCHDLRTILVKPRTPEAWKSTVARMATRSTTLNPINESEQWSVIAYLIAISPTLREGVSDQQAESIEDSENWNAARQIAKALPATLDVEAAEKLFLKKCSQCHSPLLVEHVGLKSQDDAVALVTRMVANGLAANDVEMGQIMAYLAHRFSDNQNP
jgi:mono/diheme cytochrome c family protein